MLFPLITDTTPEIVKMSIQVIEENHVIALGYNKLEFISEYYKYKLFCKLPHNSIIELYNRIYIQFYVLNYGLYDFSHIVNHSHIQFLYDIFRDFHTKTDEVVQEWSRLGIGYSFNPSALLRRSLSFIKLCFVSVLMHDPNFSGVLNNNVYLTAYNILNLPEGISDMCSRAGFTININPGVSYIPNSITGDELEFYGCVSKHQKILEYQTGQFEIAYNALHQNDPITWGRVNLIYDLLESSDRS